MCASQVWESEIWKLGLDAQPESKDLKFSKHINFLT
jgi:hypothetical protein